MLLSSSDARRVSSPPPPPLLLLLTITLVGSLQVRCDLASGQTINSSQLVAQHANETSTRQVDQFHIKTFLRSNRTSRELSSPLPVIKCSQNANDEKFIEAGEVAMRFDKELIKNLRVSDFLQMGLIAQVQSSAYSDKFIHRYETFEEMKLANGPEVDNDKCTQQLEHMLRRVQEDQSKKFGSNHMEVYHLLDMWGRITSGLLMGNFFTEGNYDECVSTNISWIGSGNRYCVLKYKLNDWNQIDRHDVIALSTGICIPNSCDSAKHKNKYQLIEELWKQHQFKGIESSQLKIVDLYCLPDANSPLRSIWQSPKSVAVLSCFSAWFCLLLYATHKYNKLCKELAREKSADEIVSCPNKVEMGRMNLFRMLSITNNFRLLFDTSRGSSLVETSSDKEKTSDASRGTSGDKARHNSGDLDLSCIEGIKVVAMCYIIMGHVLMCMPTIMRNGRDLAEQGVYSIAFLTANLVPASAVNSFFAITGILTSYLLFKQNKQQQVITSPAKWAAFILFRYLRIMPMYALAVLYCKTLAKYTGSGPLWDYGTSALSQRRVCEQENWSWTLTFTSNFLSPMEHCIPGGWYLSNDFQFFLVTPVYVALLYWRPRLGKLLLYASIAAGYLAGFFSVYNSDVQDLRPIANFSPSGFKTYISRLSFNYTYPHYRIPAYLIGLLVGYKMYCLEQERAKFNKLSEEERQGKEAPNWAPIFRKHGAHLYTVLIIAAVLSPVIGLLIPFNKAAARFMVSLVNPTYHVGFAFIVSAFIMLNSTGDANKQISRLLSAKFWKPMARLSLCAVLVNVEVINYIIQNSTRGQHITNYSLFVLNCCCILATYISATIVCCLFEAPIRSALNVVIARVMKRTSNKQKS